MLMPGPDFWWIHVIRGEEKKKKDKLRGKKELNDLVLGKGGA